MLTRFVQFNFEIPSADRHPEHPGTPHTPELFSRPTKNLFKFNKFNYSVRTHVTTNNFARTGTRGTQGTHEQIIIYFMIPLIDVCMPRASKRTSARDIIEEQ